MFIPRVFGLLLLLVLLFGCSQPQENQDNGSGFQGNGFGNVAANELFQKMASLEKENPVVELPSDLIEADFEAGKIDEETYFLELAAFYFDLGSLDEKYPVPTVSEEEEIDIDPNYLLEEIRDNFDSLSPEAQKTLEPLVLPPDDPNSFFYSEGEYYDYDSSKYNFSPIVTDNGVVYFSDSDVALFMDHPHPSGKKIMLKIPEGYSMDNVNIILASLSKAYEMYVAMGMKEPTEWIHAEVTGINSRPGFITRGQAYIGHLTTDPTKRCILEVNQKITDSVRLKSVPAHELFHCFQYYVPLKYNTNDNKWIMEATAVWAEHYVYPELNTEHSRDKRIFPTLDKKLTEIKGLRNYGSYLLFFFLYQREGNDPTVIKKLLDASKPSNVVSALEGIANFPNEFHDYSLWNLNYSPWIKFYWDADNKPSMVPYGTSIETLFVPANIEEPQSVALENGSMKYYLFSFEDDFDLFTVDVSKINKKANPNAGLWAVYKLNDEWLYYDASKEDEIKFCLKKPSEDIEAFILITSNSNLRAPLNGSFKYSSKGKCDPDWSGYTRISWKGTRTNTITGIGTSTYTVSGNYFVREILVYDSEEDEFLVKKASATYSKNEKELSVYEGKSCGTMSKTRIDSATGGGMFSKKPSSDSMYIIRDELPTRIDPVEDKPGFYEWNPRRIESALTARYYTKFVENVVPCLGVGITTPTPNTTQVIDYESGLQEPDFEMPELKLSNDKKTLSASETITKNNDGLQMTITIDSVYSMQR